MLKAKVFSWGQPHYLEARLNDFFNTEKLRSDQIISVTQAESRVGDDGGQSFTVTIIYEDSSREASSIPQPIPEAIQATVTGKEAKIARYRSISKRAFEKWGTSHQVCQTQEELGELIVALNKHYFRQDTFTPVDQLAGEIADVAIMLSQLRLMLGDELIDKAIEEKFDQLEKRLEEDE